METPDAVDHHISSGNTVTGEAIEIGGFDASHNTSPWEQDTRFLVMYEPQLEQPGLTDYQVVDAVTGEVIDEIAGVPESTGNGPGLGWRSVVSTNDGNTEVIAFGSSHIYLMAMVDGTPVVRQIASPPGFSPEANGVVDMFLSPDGSLLSLTLNGDELRTRWLLPLDGETDAWVEVPGAVPGEGPGSIFFVPGTGSAND